MSEKLRVGDQSDDSPQHSPLSEPLTADKKPTESEPSPGLLRRFWNLLSGGSGDSNYGDNYYN